MVEEFVVLEGKDLDALIEEGLDKLKTTKDKVNIEILQEGKTIVGITIKDYKIKMNVKEEIVKKSETLKEVKVKEFLKMDLNQMKPLLDSGVEIKVTKDKMEAYIVLHNTDHKINEDEEIIKLSLDQILSKIKEIIKHGLDEKATKDLLMEKNYGVDNLIAKGVSPIDGINGYIDYKFREDGSNSPSILKDGSVDFRNLNLITNVAKGDLLAVLNKSIPGEDGISVLGDTIKHKPAIETKLNFGSNVSLSADETELTSDLDGQVCIENKKIKVYEIYNINGDVDNSTGNIEFNGNVKISGNVLTGFKVIAKGNIEIDGVVEGAEVRAGGNLIIKRGIQGFNMAKIHSNSNIYTNFIENSKVTCEGTIESEAIMHSETLCEGSVKVLGKKGLLVGGLCKAVEEISAKVIGSNMATATALEVGLDPRIREKYDELKKTRKSTIKDIDKFGKMISHLTKLNQEGQLEEDKKGMLNQSITAKLQLEKKSMDIEEELNDIEEKVESSLDGKIKVEDVIYPGVRITMGNSQMRIDEPREHCTIYRDKEDREIKIGAF